jgi:hypothetical protein
MAFDPSTPPKAYLATSNGVYVTLDGTTFNPTGWSITSPVNVAVDPSNAAHILVSSTTGGEFGSVYVTTNGGSTWTTATGIAPSAEFYPGDAPVIAVSPTHGYIVFAATGTQVFRSLDGGATFTSLKTFSVDAALANQTRRDLMELRSGKEDDDDLPQRSKRFKRSSRPAIRTPQSPGANVGETLAFADNTPAGAVAPLIYTLPARSLLASTDYGSHWHDISANSISHWFSEVAFQNGTMYVATEGNGVLESTAVLQGAPAARRRQFSIHLKRAKR